MAILNNFSRLWGIGAVPSYLVPGPVVIRIEEYCILEYRSHIEELVVGVGSGVIGLSIKGMLTGNHLLSPRIG